MTTGIVSTNDFISGVCGSGYQAPDMSIQSSKPRNLEPRYRKHPKYNYWYSLMSFSFVALFYLLCVSNCIMGVKAIDCFKCVSLNGNNPACEDPFHNNYSTTILESPCMAGRKGRGGLFPATACIKLAGYHGPKSEKLMIRACALDSGSLTTDTEIIRVSHCGSFYFQDKYVKGCLQSCADYDGCNGASSLATFFSKGNYLILLCIIQYLII